MKANDEDPAQEQRIDALHKRLAEIAGGQYSQVSFGKENPDVEEMFLNHVHAFETAPRTTHLDRLRAAGCEMPDTEGLDDSALHVVLHNCIEGLAALRVYLSDTDHLSDRELYVLLREELLTEETVDPSFDPDLACHLDVLGSGSEEDTRDWLKYYADERDRAQWQDSFPDYAMPAHEDPPYPRDLPKRGAPYDVSPAEALDLLIRADWDDASGTIRLAADLAPEELSAAPIWQNARIFLQTVDAAGGAPLTQNGNLSRAFVAETLERLQWAPGELADVRHYNKVINEEDVAVLHKVRVLCQEGRLIRRHKKRFVLTRAARALLADDQGGRLYRSLFLAFFRRVNLAYFDGSREMPGIQHTAAVILWRLKQVAGEWIEKERLPEEVLLPDVLDELRDSARFEDHVPLLLYIRFLRHLEAFGLLETDPPEAERGREDPRAFRKSPLFDRFIRFTV